MDSEQIIKLLLVLVVVVLPALTATAALAARFAVKPIVEAIIRLRELGAPNPVPQVEARLGAVESEMHELRTLVERMVAAADFDAQIRAGSRAEIPRLPQA